MFLAASRYRECSYCTAAHSVIADTASRVPRAVTDALRSGGRVPDPKLEMLAGRPRVLLQMRGQPSNDDADSFLAAGYDERHMLEIVLATAVKTLSSYTNPLFQTPLDEAFASRLWQPIETDGAAAADVG